MWWNGCTVAVFFSRTEKLKPKTQELFLHLDGNTVFLYAGLRIASKMKASVLTSRMEQ